MNMNRQVKQKNSAQEKESCQKLAHTLLVLIVTIIVVMPLHGFLTTWAGSTFDNLLLWRAWKELLLIPASVIGLILFLKDATLRNELFGKRRTLLVLLTLFTFWKIVNTAFGGENAAAATLGLAIHVRWVVIFVLALITSFYVPVSQQNIVKLVLVPAVAVVGFGLLQMFILPHDFLKHFGYEKNVTIPPFFTIDEQLDRLRIASTLRGPNPLGVYLIVPILLVASSLKFIGGSRKKLLASSFSLLALLIVLFGSHSRGAWLGLVAALGAFVLIKIPQRFRLAVVGVGAVVLLFGMLGVYQYRNTNFVQDVILHDNPEEGGEVSSNEGHIESLKLGVENIAESPIVGCGVGCAGPASAHNTNGAQLSENYFVQTAEESGLIGLILLLMILGYIVFLLLKRTNEPLAVALLTSFVGISVASLTAHAWADDTISYVWWGILGLYLYNNQLGTQNGKEKTKNISTKKALTKS